MYKTVAKIANCGRNVLRQKITFFMGFSLLYRVKSHFSPLEYKRLAGGKILAATSGPLPLALPTSSICCCLSMGFPTTANDLAGSDSGIFPNPSGRLATLAEPRKAYIIIILYIHA